MAKQMKLISEADFNRLSQNANPSIPSNSNEASFIRNSNKANILLQTQESPDDIKLAMYTGLMNSISEHLRNFLETPILVKNVDEPKSSSHANSSCSTTSTSEEISAEASTSSANTSTSSSLELNSIDHQLISKLPEKCKKKASDIMLSLKEHPELIRWNNNGEVAFFDQEFEGGSSIVDLLSYAVHDLKWSIAPKATNRFLLCLKQLNVPLSLMRADVRKMLSKDIDHITDVKSAGNSPSYFVQMKSKLRDWVSLKDSSQSEFTPKKTSSPKK